MKLLENVFSKSWTNRFNVNTIFSFLWMFLFKEVENCEKNHILDRIVGSCSFNFEIHLRM